MTSNLRSDARRSQMLLTDGVERLLREGRSGFSLPELASEAGVGVATAYRHFPTTDAALHGFYARAIERLIESFTEADPKADPATRFRWFCRRWIEQATEWGPAARQIRSRLGFIERLHDGDRSIARLHDVLRAVLADLVDAKLMPKVDLTYAVLLWTTIFDERVVYDLTEHHGWSTRRAVDHLTAAISGALRIDASA